VSGQYNIIVVRVNIRLFSEHDPFFDPKVSVRAGFLTFVELSVFLTICYFLNLLLILIVLNMQRDIPTF
jgi:hypothetical protein